MKFCLVSHDPYYPLVGGGCLRFNKLAKHLAKKDDVYVIAPSEKTRDDNVKIYPFNLFNFSRFDKNKAIKYALFSFLLIPMIIMNRKKYRINVIVAHNADAGFSAVVAGKILGIKSIVDTTDILSEYMETYKNIYKFFRWFVIKFELITYKHADKVIVVSNAMKKYLIEKGVKQERIEVIYDGAETEKLRVNTIPKKPIIIHHGGIDPYNNVQFIPKAMLHVVKKKPDINIYILGDGLCLDEVKEITEKNKLNKNFTFTGWIDYNNILPYLRKTSIGIISRSNTRANHLVLTLKLLEYWASGNAVVAPRLEAIEEVVTEGKNALLYEPENEIDLAKKILKLIENDKLRTKLIKEGKKILANKFDWDNLINKLVEICRSA